MDVPVPVITIDGHAAVGKGTTARAVAADLGFAFLESGRFYRCVAMAAVAAGADLDDPDGVLAVAAPLLADAAGWDRALADPSLASEAAGLAGSRVALLVPVRAALTAPMRAKRCPPGLVAEGRDMGSIVFADATLKVFLEASLDVREQRAAGRSATLLGSGNGRIAGSLDDFHARNARDSKRCVAPVAPAPGAERICTDDLDVAAAVAQVVRLYRRQEGRQAPSRGNSPTTKK